MPTDGRLIKNNSAHDMQRYGYVVLAYNLLADGWVGVDVEGNYWTITSDQLELATWSHAECEDRLYRVAKPVDLRTAGAMCIPKQNVNDARNGG